MQLSSTIKNCLTFHKNTASPTLFNSQLYHVINFIDSIQEDTQKSLFAQYKLSYLGTLAEGRKMFAKSALIYMEDQTGRE